MHVVAYFIYTSWGQNLNGRISDFIEMIYICCYMFIYYVSFKKKLLLSGPLLKKKKKKLKPNLHLKKDGRITMANLIIIISPLKFIQFVLDYYFLRKTLSFELLGTLCKAKCKNEYSMRAKTLLFFSFLEEKKK